MDSPSQLPRATVALPPDGPPAMSPRARRAAQRLDVPLQALPIPGSGKRITEKDVLLAAKARAGVPMTAAARQLAAERGVDAGPLARKLGRRLHAADVAKLDPVALRLPAERARLTPAELQAAVSATRTVREVPQIAMEAFVPAGALIREQPAAVTAMWIKALAGLLADEAFKPFRAVIDGEDLVYRGQINIAYIVHRAGRSRTYSIANAEKRTVAQLADLLKTEPTMAETEGGGALITLLDMSHVPVDAVRTDVTAGQSAVMTVSSLQARTVHHAGVNEWRVERGWNLYVAADARVIGADLLGFFISRLKSLLVDPSMLV